MNGSTDDKSGITKNGTDNHHQIIEITSKEQENDDEQLLKSKSKKNIVELDASEQQEKSMIELLLKQKFENMENQSATGSQVRFSQNIER